MHQSIKQIYRKCYLPFLLPVLRMLQLLSDSKSQGELLVLMNDS